MARRNATRRSSCCAIDWATSVASISGLRTSTMLRCVSDLVISVSFLRSFSMSAPFLPMMRPGRAAWIVTRHFLCGRSITTFETAACFSSFSRYSRIFRSSCSSLPYSPVFAYQRESQVRLMPRRRPIGLIFWPIRRPPLSLRLHARRSSGARTASRCGDARPRPRAWKRFMTIDLPT